MKAPAKAQAMKALTVWQPWASLIIGGWKPYEFRPRPAPSWWAEGRRIVIHAGARRVVLREVIDLMEDLMAGRNCGGLDPKCLPFLGRVVGDPTCIPYSACLGTALLGKSVLSSELWPGEFTNDSDRVDKANWALPLSDIERWRPPVPSRGFQGWWPWVGETRL